MKKYVRPTVETVEVRSEGVLANSFNPDGEFSGPIGAKRGYGVEVYDDDYFDYYDD